MWELFKRVFTLKLSTQMISSYLSAMFGFSFIAAAMLIFIEEPLISSAVSTLSRTMRDSELTNLGVRLDTLLGTTSSLFAQFVADVDYQYVYATAVFHDELPVTSFYPNYFVLDVNTHAPPDLMDGSSSNYSSWYKHTNASTAVYLNQSSILDNSHGAIFRSNPSFESGLYMGFNDGMMRNYPYQNVSYRYITMNYTCAHSNTWIIGYDPRCRVWYNLAINSGPDETVFTEPYNDASTGLVMITIARTVKNRTDNSIIGVVGADVTLKSLDETVINAKVMDNGYTYMIDKDKQLIVHPAVDWSVTDGKIYRVSEVEFSGSSAEEIAIFDDILDNHVLEGQTNSTAFDKKGDKWYVTYGPIKGTSYFLLMVVPHGDIVAPATSLRESTNIALASLGGVLFVLLMVIRSVGTYFAFNVTKKITGPVISLSQSLQSIVEENVVGEVNNLQFDEVNKLQRKVHKLFLAVKFTHDSSYYISNIKGALESLEEVENMFECMGQKEALGVIYNNKGNMLRRQEGRSDRLEAALASFRRALDNIVEIIDAFKSGNRPSPECLGSLQDAENGSNSKRTSASLYSKIGICAESKLNDKEYLDKLHATYALRLSNFGDCLREARRFDEAFKQLDMSYALFVELENTESIVQTLGNKALVFMDQEKYDEAEEVLNHALDVANKAFFLEKNDLTMFNVQLAKMNFGLFYFNRAKKLLNPAGNALVPLHLMSDSWTIKDYPEAHKLMELAMNQFYCVLGIANNNHKVAHAVCISTLNDIYLNYYGDAGKEASQRLFEMFPSEDPDEPLLSGKLKVAEDGDRGMNYLRQSLAEGVIKEFTTASGNITMESL